MKFTKLSLVAALAISTAMAGGDVAPIQNEEVAAAPSAWSFSGDVKLYYTTTDFEDADGTKHDLFSQETAAGQAAVSADVSYAFSDTWKANVGITGLATLGLDDNVVSGVWLFAGANASDGSLPFTSVGDALWVDTANVTGSVMDGKATFILGRTELDTPLAFSETWTIAKNTFDAAVAMVKPIDNLTIVGGYIYDGNGNGDRISTMGGGFTGDKGYMDGLAGVEEGAYTIAAIGSFSGVTAQAWYYDVIDVAQAVWVQADAEFKGFKIGGQYAYIDPSDLGEALGADLSNNESTAYAAKIGYAMDKFNVWAAYSKVDEEGMLAVSNTATMLSGAGWGGVARTEPAGQSKLYTEAWWNYGYVGLPGAETIAAAASYAFSDNIKVTGQYTTVSDAINSVGHALLGEEAMTYGVDEFTALLETSAYGLNLALAYIWAKYTVTDTATAVEKSHDNNTVQVYVTYKF